MKSETKYPHEVVMEWVETWAWILFIMGGILLYVGSTIQLTILPPWIYVVIIMGMAALTLGFVVMGFVSLNVSDP